MPGRPWTRQLLLAMAAVLLLVAAGMLQPLLDRQSRQYRLNPPEVVENYPLKTLLTVAPGGLRAPLVSYLWIRAEKLKEKGRHYEAMQLADLICKLQPNFAGVWAFQAWNMAWNISVTTHTPEERWLWVHNAIKLLRDQGIPQNRRSLVLYKELGWIYYHKMSRYMDEMHLAYKQRWAARMQRLLAAPPYGTVAETIDAFRPIAAAPIDKDFRRQGKATIQKDQLAIVLSEPATAAYAALLEEKGISISEALLDVYNRYTTDEAVQVVRLAAPELRTQRDRELAALVNSPEHSEARKKLLAFVRAQVLWNVYKLDPDWMLQLMEKYGPLDWRLPVSQALYWTTYGLHVCEARELGDINSLNTDRVVLSCLKMMTWTGRLTYIENPHDADAPFITWGADWRFIDPTQEEYILMSHEMAKARGDEYQRNQLSVGHINYLADAIEMLYAGYRRKKAQEFLDWIIENYNPSGPEWSMELEDFVIYRLTRDGQITQDLAYSQISPAIQTAFLQRVAGSTDGYNRSMAYALRVYRAYQKDVPTRIAMPAFNVLVRNTLINMLIRPRIIGINMSLPVRANLYGSLDDQMQRMVYDRVAMPLSVQCKANGIDFARAFPAPPGMAEYRQQRQAPGQSVR